MPKKLTKQDVKFVLPEAFLIESKDRDGNFSCYINFQNISGIKFYKSIKFASTYEIGANNCITEASLFTDYDAESFEIELRKRKVSYLKAWGVDSKQKQIDIVRDEYIFFAPLCNVIAADSRSIHLKGDVPNGLFLSRWALYNSEFNPADINKTNVIIYTKENSKKQFVNFQAVNNISFYQSSNSFTISDGLFGLTETKYNAESFEKKLNMSYVPYIKIVKSTPAARVKKGRGKSSFSGPSQTVTQFVPITKDFKDSKNLTAVAESEVVESIKYVEPFINLVQ